MKLSLTVNHVEMEFISYVRELVSVSIIFPDDTADSSYMWDSFIASSYSENYKF
jgi:hypothetical protein